MKKHITPTLAGKIILALSCLLLAPDMQAQGVILPEPLNETLWTGAAGDNRWDNPANWHYNAVPNGGTYINIRPGLHPITFDLTGVSGTYYAYGFDLNDRSNGAIMNIRGTETGTVIMDFTGQPAAWWLFSGDNPVGGIDNLPQVVFNVGENGILKYSMISTGTAEAFTRFGGGASHVRLTDNGMFDISARMLVEISGTDVVDVRRAPVHVSVLQAEAGTTITLGRNPLNLGANQRVVSVSEIAGSIQAADGGVLNKTGAGTLILSGQNDFGFGEYWSDLYDKNLIDDNGILITGSDISNASREARNIVMSQLSAGMLVVNSNIGALRVSGNDTILAGHGETGTLILESGMITGGAGRNSPDVGTLTVNGNFEIYASTTTTIWIDIGKNGTHDSIHVSGSAVISGTTTTLRLWAADNSMAAGSYKFLTSDSVITGTFMKNRVLIPESLTLAPADPENPVILSADQKTMSVKLLQLPFSKVKGLSDGQMKVAGYLDFLISMADPDAPGSFNPLVGVMNAKSVRGYYADTIDREASLKLLADSLNQLTPMAYASIYQAAVAGVNTITEGVENRADLAYQQPFRDKFSLYTNYAYSTSRSEATLDYESAKMDTSYYTIGGSKSVGDNFMIGAELTIGDGAYIPDKDGSKIKSNSYTMSVYGAWKRENFTFGGLALFGSDNFNAQRSVRKTGQADYVRADIDGSRNGLGAWATYRYAIKSFALRPYGSIHWMNWTMNRFEEKGSSSVALTVEKQKEDLVQSRLGVRAEKALFAQNHQNSLFHLFLDVSWVYLWQGTDARTVRTSLEGYSVDAVFPEMTDSGVRATLGMSAALNNRWTFLVGATAQRDGGFDTQYNYHATIGYKF